MKSCFKSTKKVHVVYQIKKFCILEKYLYLLFQVNNKVITQSLIASITNKTFNAKIIWHEQRLKTTENHRMIFQNLE
ncbi:hypothetical protein EUTSA_v10015181mg [Eutrema salsugineum]|uniref:Uncharacterized protein n=1 Tax=Eutrema salsugineum TaxID=72664 RepID=V4NA64_EUTSA|nr:hypothetical protein EUTSA_v10015181mg [Eutrema salsugineum]